MSKGVKILLFAFIFNFFSTWYYGWNLHPEGEWEHAGDHFCIILITLGFAQIMWRAELDKRDKKGKK